MVQNILEKIIIRLFTKRYYVPIMLVLASYFLYLASTSNFYAHVLFNILLYAGLGGAWNLIGGFAGQLSLGHAAFLGMGAYTSTILVVDHGVSVFLSLIIAALVGALLAAFIGFTSLRLRGIYFTLLTIAFAEVLRTIAVNVPTITRGSHGIPIPFRPGWQNLIFAQKMPYLLVIGIFVVIVTLISYYIKSSKLGWNLVALGQEEQAAEACGINVSLSKIITMIISGSLVAVGGVLHANYVLYIDPSLAGEFGFQWSINMVLISLLGGMGTVAGPIIGAFILIPLAELSRAYFGGMVQGLHLIIYGVSLLLIILFLPEGIIGRLNKIKKRLASPEEMAAEKPVEIEETRRTLLHAHPLPVQTLTAGVTDKPVSDNLLEIKGLTTRFGGLVALNDVSLTIKRNSCTGLIGPNGAGKSTLFNNISGFIRPKKGDIYFNGNLINNLAPHQRAKIGIGRTFQIVKPFENLTVLQNVTIGALSRYSNHKLAQEHATHCLEFVGLIDSRDIVIKNLTIANRKKVEIARAIACNPQILMLDEPMAGLNPKETEVLSEFIIEMCSQGLTVFLIEHQIDALLELVSQVYVIQYGVKIAEGTPDSIVVNEKVIEAYLGREVDEEHAS